MLITERASDVYERNFVFFRRGVFPNVHVQSLKETRPLVPMASGAARD